MSLNVSANLGNRIYAGTNSGNNQLPFLVYLRGRTQCTGALIGTGPDNAWVLTAKHCIDRENMIVYGRNTFVNTKYYLCGQSEPCTNDGCANYGPRKFKYASTANSLRQNHIILKPNSQYPNIQIARPNHFERFYEDVALIKLDNLNNYPSTTCHSFATISEIPMNNNDLLTHYGYGLDDRMGASYPPFPFNAGILRKVNSRVSEIIFRPGGSGYAATQTYVVRPSSSQEGIRQGDSGGPMMWPSTHPRAHQLVAVHNWIADSSDPISETGSLSLQEPTTLSWIYEVVYNQPPPSPPPPNNPFPPPIPFSPPTPPLLPIDPSPPLLPPNPPYNPPNSPPNYPPAISPLTSPLTSQPFDFITVIVVTVASIISVGLGSLIYIYRKTLFPLIGKQTIKTTTETTESEDS